MDNIPENKTFSRRDWLKGLGAMGALSIAGPLLSLASCAPGVSNPSHSGSTSSQSDLAPDCSLTPTQVEGPYYIKASQVRQDISEGRAGLPMRLALTVLNARTCAPIPDAMVDIWHADAMGLYSAYTGQGDSRNVDTTGQTFLRGIQVTGADGKASFTTLYPGWYPGRSTHIHFKIHFNDQTMVTSQLYFPEATSTEVYTTHSAYKARGDQDTPNASDFIRRQASGAERLDMKTEKSGDLVIASINIGIALPS